MTREVLKRLFEAAAFSDAEKMTEELFAKYHDLDGIISADPHALSGLIGERAAMLVKLAAALASRRDTEKLSVGDKCDPLALGEFLVALFRGSSVEIVYAVCLDRSDRVLAVELVGEGTVNSANITPRRLVDIAVKNRAVSVVIAHNHPSGRVDPSRQDLDFTDSLRAMLDSVGIRLVAHYTVAGSNCKKIY